MPLQSKELARQFRASAWNTPQEMDQFAAAAHPVPPNDLVSMLAVLVDRKASTEGRSHALRVTVFHKLWDS